MPSRTIKSRPPTAPVSPLRFTVLLLAALVVLHGVNLLTGMRLCDLGIVPRSLIGLRGIVLAPLIHGSFGHLFSNLPPLAFLLGALALDRKHAFYETLAGIWLLCGLGAWIISRPHTICFGASGVVYGLATFYLTSAITARSWWAVMVGIVMLPMYTGLVWGLLPGSPGISWECHLCGAIAGFAMARATR